MPITGQTIPKLELSAAFILTRLMSKVKEAIQSNIKIRSIIDLSPNYVIPARAMHCGTCDHALRCFLLL